MGRLRPAAGRHGGAACAPGLESNEDRAGRWCAGFEKRRSGARDALGASDGTRRQKVTSPRSSTSLTRAILRRIALFFYLTTFLDLSSSYMYVSYLYGTDRFLHQVASERQRRIPGAVDSRRPGSAWV